jgi:hypothetical protein
MRCRACFSSDPEGEIQQKNGGSSERTIKKQSKPHKEEQEFNIGRKVIRVRKKRGHQF